MVVSAMTTIPVAETAYGSVETVTKSASAELVDKKMTTEAAVREYFKDIPVMIQIARCESTFRQTLADGSVLHGVVDSADIGVMQVNTRYHAQEAKALGMNLSSLKGNMAYARHLYEKKGTAPWNASAKCWNNTLALK